MLARSVLSFPWPHRPSPNQFGGVSSYLGPHHTLARRMGDSGLLMDLSRDSNLDSGLCPPPNSRLDFTPFLDFPGFCCLVPGVPVFVSSRVRPLSLCASFAGALQRRDHRTRVHWFRLPPWTQHLLTEFPPLRLSAWLSTLATGRRHSFRQH